MEYTNNNEQLLFSEAERIGYEALMEVTAKYGFGDEEVDTLQPPTIQPLAYHNAQHTLRVRTATRELATRHGLSRYDIELAVMIASAHDVHHDKDGAGMSDEEKSVAWLIEKMRFAGFRAEDMEIARLAILGTQPLSDTEGTFMGQQFILTEFPSVRAGEIALCVAAADLEAIFAPYGPRVAHDLLKERLGIASTRDPQTLEGVAEFQQLQLDLLTTYQPLYPELELLFGNLRQEILDYQAELLHNIQNGVVTTWKEIIARDADFAERYADRRTF